MTSGGHAFELLESVHPTIETAGSESPSPATPTARDWKSRASNLHGQNARPLNEQVLAYFGTPVVNSANGHGDVTNRRNLTRLPTQVVVLKTPTSNLGSNGAAQHPDKRKAGGHGPTLDDEAAFLLVQDWGKYEPAVRRWEEITDQPAPLPTEIGPRGGRRLSAKFAEWMMGIPAGWVTGVPGMSRQKQLRAIGNGVVPLQAYGAYSYLLQAMGEELPVTGRKNCQSAVEQA
jgi:site-specific DNA-cytosine methylase